MAVTAVIPVKQLGEAKTRLMSELPAVERARLALALLANVLDAVGGAPAITRTLVVTPDVDVARLARGRGAEVVHQEQPGLNLAIQLGHAAVDDPEDIVLALLGDLPFLTSADLDQLLQLVEPGVVVLAPDRHRRGTNALAVQRDEPFEPAFGENSLALHRREAARLGLAVREYRSRGTGFDVDTAEDLQEYVRARSGVAEG